MSEETVNPFKLYDVRWYLSYEILYYELCDKAAQGDDILVWENLVLIEADSPEQAYQKAIEHGKASEEKVKINGKDGRCIFKGLKRLMPIYEKFEDGSEIEWREYEVSRAELDKLVVPKENLALWE